MVGVTKVKTRRPTVLIRVLKKPVTLASSGAYRQARERTEAAQAPAIVPILKLIGDSRTGQVIAVVSENVVPRRSP